MNKAHGLEKRDKKKLCPNNTTENRHCTHENAKIIGYFHGMHMHIDKYKNMYTYIFPTYVFVDKQKSTGK